MDPSGNVPGGPQKCFGKDGFGQKCGQPLLDGVFSVEAIANDPTFLLQTGLSNNQDLINYQKGSSVDPGLKGPYATRAINYSMALEILAHDNASFGQKAFAGGYMLLDGMMHVGLAAGTGGYLCFSFSPACLALAQKALTVSAAACADADCTNEAKSVASLWPQLTGNGSSLHVVNHINYSEHAIIRAIERGISPNTVEEALRLGRYLPNTMRQDIRTLINHGDINVVLTHTQNVITTIFRSGAP